MDDASKKSSTESRNVKLPSLIRLFLIIDCALASAYLFNFAIGQPFYFPTILIDLNREANLPTWYASLKLAAVGALLGLVACRQLEPMRIRSWPLAALALLFLVLSVDETAGIHEWIGWKIDTLFQGGRREGTVFKLTGIWMFIVGIPGAVAIVLLIWAARPYLRVAPDAVVKFLAGVAIMATGALGVEILSNFVMIDSAAFAIWTCLEEFLEMVGVTVMLWGAVDLQRAYGLRLSFDRASHP